MYGQPIIDIIQNRELLKEEEIHAVERFVYGTSDLTEGVACSVEWISD